MAENRPVPKNGSPPTEGQYTYGHSAVVVNVHGLRTAAQDAAFLLPHLKPGMRLLDVGCGPGSITIGLAQAVAPGEVVGVDLSISVIERARSLAAENRIDNVRFEEANAYELPFADGSFDAIFAHTLLEHVPDRGKALAEMRRVLRSGGVIGIRDADWSSGIYWPRVPEMDVAVDLYARVWAQNGGHPDCGRQVGMLLADAGFAQIIGSAGFRWDGSLPSSQSFGELLAERFALSNMTELALRMRWIDEETLARLRTACRAWSRRSDVYAAMIMGEAVGWAP